jgi:flagellar basal-body rod protein FlgG
MNQSFNICSVGAMAQRNKMDIIGNNIANVNTVGYKYKNANFTDLLYNNIHKHDDDDTLKKNTGAKIVSSDTENVQGSYMPTERDLDFAIDGDGYFVVEDSSGNRYYTRDGAFNLVNQGDDTFALRTSSGDYVLDKNLDKIIVNNTTEVNKQDFALVRFNNREGIMSVGDNKFVPVAKNGNPEFDEISTVHDKMLEASNVNLAAEMTDVIQAQRAYQLNLRMVSLSDEIQQTINSLR